MPFAIQTFDKPGHQHVRTATRERHIAYLKAHLHLLIAAGGLVSDDGTTGLGSVLLVDTDDRAVAEGFIAGDPFTEAGLFERVLVTRWRKSFFDGKHLV